MMAKMSVSLTRLDGCWTSSQKSTKRRLRSGLKHRTACSLKNRTINNNIRSVERKVSKRLSEKLRTVMTVRNWLYSCYHFLKAKLGVAQKQRGVKCRESSVYKHLSWHTHVTTRICFKMSIPVVFITLRV